MSLFGVSLVLLVGGVNAFSSSSPSPSLLPSRHSLLARRGGGGTTTTIGGSLTKRNAFTVKQEEKQNTAPTASSSSSSSPPPLAPLTIWGEPIYDIVVTQSKFRRLKPYPQFPSTIDCIKDASLDPTNIDAQIQYFQQNAMLIKELMIDNGAVIFRNFDLMKTQDGFQNFYNALGMSVCLDPLHSVSARPTVDGSKNSPVYEAVNKESRKNFFIGMHNEFVGTRAPRAAAFVCFKAAEVGGEFLICDGRAMFRDLSSELIEKLYNRNIRYSVMELPFFGFMDKLPEFMQQGAQSTVKGLVSSAINAKVDFDVELLWGVDGYDKQRMLQARAPSQPPILRHPTSGEPTWFCNVHSHSSKLRKSREGKYGAERFEDGASRINKSDMFYGDDEELSDDDLAELDEITMKNVKYVKMTEGDVVLLDNYKTMHGRNVFDGTRKHGVAWFGGWEGEEEMKERKKIETLSY